MTATNNEAGVSALNAEQASVLNFSPSEGVIVTPPPEPALKPEDTLELPVHPGIPEDLPSVPNEEVLQLFETFVRVARNEHGAAAELANKNAEIGQLKELLLEAQETIISLLNDRVLDRSRISKLEAEVKLLPDLQSQATRAMGLAIRSEDVQAELEQVRAEVERLRTSYMRAEQKPKGFFSRLLGR